MPSSGVHRINILKVYKIVFFPVNYGRFILIATLQHKISDLDVSCMGCTDNDFSCWECNTVNIII